MKFRHKNKQVYLFSLFALFMMSCAGADVMPDYFGTENKEPSPPPSEEKPPESQIVVAHKLVLSDSNTIVELSLPEGSIMEIGSGTYIAKSPDQIGSRYESSASFRISNVSGDTTELNIPSFIGAFHITSKESLHGALASKKSVDFTISFRPTISNTAHPGKSIETLQIGDSTFKLVGLVLASGGQPQVDLLNATGEIVKNQLDQIDIGHIDLQASARKSYFQCDIQLCGSEPLPINCRACLNILDKRCKLLSIDSEGHAVDEVDKHCEKKSSGLDDWLIPSFSQADQSKAIKQTVQLINVGTASLKIFDIAIVENKDSKSVGEFLLNKSAIFMADAYPATSETPSASQKMDQNAIELQPFDPPVESNRLFIPITYFPKDLIGYDGKSAEVGSPVKDVAFLKIQTSTATLMLPITGDTAIRDVPALSVYFKTTTGLKSYQDNDSFAFWGITAETENIAVPMYLNLSENASTPLRITNISITENINNNFEWLNSKAKIFAKPEDERCTIPVLDPQGNQIDMITDVEPVIIPSDGFNITPGQYSADNLPLFGCLNFQRLESTLAKGSQFSAKLEITAQEIGSNGKPIKNKDGSIRETTLSVTLLAVVDPVHGKLVVRLTQTMSAIMNPEFPGLSAVTSDDVLEIEIAEGRAVNRDRFVTLGALILDPFDQESVATESENIITMPNDAITAVFRAIDTHPVSTTYEDPALFDYIGLIHSESQPLGSQGLFFDYPNVPDNFAANGLRIFTTSLSYPGPLAAASEKPNQPSRCEIVDPCTIEGQSKLGSGGAGGKAVCAFFNTSTGKYDSSSFQPDSTGKSKDLCELKGGNQNLKDLTGHYSLDGHLSFEDSGIRLWGPTYFHSPAGPLGSVPPLNEVFHMSLNTGVMLPPEKTPGHNFIPDSRINFSKQEHKLNLNDSSLDTPQLCPNNTSNVTILGKKYGSWLYFAPFLSKDEEGKIPAGCPTPNSSFDGGSAFIHGRPINQESGIFSVVAIGKFSSNDDLTFAFQDVMIYIVLNGWVCDPNGAEKNFEGSLCFDKSFNERDAASQISLLKESHE